MRFKSKYFILFKNDLNEKICWPPDWGNTCRDNLGPMLAEVLKTNGIASELKTIINSEHERRMINEHKITREQLGDYLKSPCGSLHFSSKTTRKRALKALHDMGAVDLVSVDCYTDLILYQVYFQNHGFFPKHEQKKLIK